MATGTVNIGDVFNDLTVVALDGKDSKNNKKFMCRCVCGEFRSVFKQNLGVVKGCGCSRKIYKKRAKYKTRSSKKETESKQAKKANWQLIEERLEALRIEREIFGF